MPLPRVHLGRYGGCLAPHSHLAWGDHPDTTPAGCGRARGQYCVAALELGAAAQARVCAGHSTLPVLPAGVATDHCCSHAWRGDPQDPPASETSRRPTPDRTSACPPGSLRLVLRLTAPGVSQTPPGSLARGCHTAFVWSCACDAPSPCRWVGRHGCRLASPPPQCVSRLPVDRTSRHRSVLHAARVCTSRSRHDSAAVII